MAGARDGVRLLNQQTQAFLAAPTEEARRAWQATWHRAHDAYLTAELLAPDGELVPRIDAWPVIPGFVDSLPEYPASGIISDETLEITADTLLTQHQITDDSEVALGFHVVEYYAFERALEDFLPGAASVQRRNQLIELVMARLVADVTDRSRRIETLLATLGYRDALAILATRAQRLADRSADWREHGEFSDSAHHALRIQLLALQRLLGNETGLSHYLIDRDASVAVTVSQTIDRLVELSVETVEEMSDDAEIRLLLSGLAVQLNGFVETLPGN